MRASGGELWRLAWRNVGRNRRRSALTVASISLGLAAVMFGQSLIKSFQRQMIDKSTGVMLGHVQAQHRSARNRKVPESLLARPGEIKSRLAQDPRVAASGARLLFTGLVSSAGGSRGVLVCGVEPAAERALSIMPGYLVSGRYLGAGPRDAYLGAALAERLDVRLGERLVAMAQGPDGQMNSELFRAVGIFRSGSETYDRDILYIPLDAAQRLRGRPGLVSHVAFKLKDGSLAEDFVRDRRSELGDPDAVLLTYKDVGSEIVGIKSFQDALLVVVLAVIFSIVAFGVLNTISMSFFERVRELGVLRAMGARPSFVVFLLLAEAAILGLLGLLGGLALGAGLIAFFGAYGILLPLTEAMGYFLPFDDVIFLRPVWGMHLRAALGVFAASLAAALSPALRAARLRVCDALRHV